MTFINKLDPMCKYELPTSRLSKVTVWQTYDTDRQTSYTHFIFTALHGMQTRSSNENSVCPSVWPTRELRQNGRKICQEFYTIHHILHHKFALLLKKVCYKVSLCENCQRRSCRSFIGLTIHAKITGGGRPLLPEILGQNDRVGEKLPIFDLFSLVALNKFLSVKTVRDRVVRHSLA